MPDDFPFLINHLQTFFTNYPQINPLIIKPQPYLSHSLFTIPIIIPHERSTPFVLSSSFYIKHRQHLLKELKFISNSFSLQAQTLILAVSYIDTLCLSKLTFNNNNNSYNEIKSLALFCLILAAKFNEVGNQGTALALEKQYKNILSSNFKSDEIFILSKLNYNLAIRTPLEIIKEIMMIGFVFTNECVNKKKMNYIYSHMEQMFLAFMESKYYIELTKDEIVFALIGFVREYLGLESFTTTFTMVYGISDVYMKYKEAISKVKNVLHVKRCK